MNEVLEMGDGGPEFLVVFEQLLILIDLFLLLLTLLVVLHQLQVL